MTMPFLGSKSNSNSKRRSHTPNTSSTASSLLSRLPLNASSPAVYYPQQHNNTSNPNVVPRMNRSTDYKAAATNSGSSSSSGPPPPPYDYRSSSPTPTPSTSWTSEMSVLADKIRDDAAALSTTTSTASTSNQQAGPTIEMLDRRSISQGMKLVAIAADEYEDGNMTVALDIYLSGIDKILMALPSMLYIVIYFSFY